MDYLWDDVKGFYAPGCRLKFFLLGNAKIGDILNTSYDQVLDWCKINLGHAPPWSNTTPQGLVDPAKLVKIKNHLDTLKTRLKSNGAGGKRSLSDMLSDRAHHPTADNQPGNQPDPDDPNRPRNGLKKLGFILPFDQARDFTAGGITHTVAQTTAEIQNNLSTYYLKNLLNDTTIKTMKATIENGKRARIFMPDFLSTDGPTIFSDDSVKVGPNGKCCSTTTGTCTTVGASATTYCQPVDPGNPNSPCNSMSDSCGP